MSAPGEEEVRSCLQQKLRKASHQQGASQRPLGSALRQRGYPDGVHAGPTGDRDTWQ